MAILVVGGILLGMILAQFFKWYVLFPACVLAIVPAFADPAHMNGFLGWFIQFVALTASLQIGYVIGLFGLRPSRTCAFEESQRPRSRHYSAK
jgi:hypothetical protein